MTALRVVFSLLILTVMVGCDTVYFKQPQPPDTPNLNRFPPRLHGEYYVPGDTNYYLQIDDKTLSIFWEGDEKTPVSQLEEQYWVQGDTLIDKTTYEKINVRIENDTVIRHVQGSDIFFSISSSSVLKKFRGHYFLNTQILSLDTKWSVRKLTLSKGQLFMNSISRYEEIEKLKEISASELDSMPYVFDPTKQQFKTFVREGGFLKSDTFLKRR